MEILATTFEDAVVELEDIFFTDIHLIFSPQYLCDFRFYSFIRWLITLEEVVIYFFDFFVNNYEV